jgi:electron transport complex protein RnfB
LDLTLIAYATITLSIAGLIMGLGLAFASKKFHVEVDPKLQEIIDALPGANCAACGYPGCSVAAEAIIQGKTSVNVCTAGGHSVASRVAEIMGHEAPDSKHPEIAFPHCIGGKKHVKNRFTFDYPIKDCQAANQIAGGFLACPSGCLGLGNCERECPFDAIKMIEDLPVVNAEKCTSCGICVSACPRSLFSIEKAKIPIYMGCSSTDKGKDVRKFCKVGCIACKACEKVCSKEAIKVINNLAVIDFEKCDGCMACVEKCPTKCIIINEAANLTTAGATAKKVEKKASSHCAPDDL